jgi:hypothetical protein
MWIQAEPPKELTMATTEKEIENKEETCSTQQQTCSTESKPAEIAEVKKEEKKEEKHGGCCGG